MQYELRPFLDPSAKARGEEWLFFAPHVNSRMKGLSTVPVVCLLSVVLGAAVATSGWRTASIMALLFAASLVALPLIRHRMAWASGLVILSLYPAAWYVPHTPWKAAAASTSLYSALRAYDLASNEATLAGHVHYTAMMVLADVPRATPVPLSSVVPRQAGRQLLIGLVAGVPALAAFMSTTHFFVRAVAGGVMLMAFLMALMFGYRIIFGIDSHQLPDIMHAPWAATTVRDFWGRRWNTTMHLLLFRAAFRPLQRRGCPVAGSLMAFLCSGLYHGLILIPLGCSQVQFCGVMGFFVAQWVLMVVERALSCRGYCWTWACVLIPAPLLVHPVLELMGG